LIKNNNYKKYCEIGCNRNSNFKRINIPYTVGIDPRRGGTLKMTSDEFFKQNNEKFDIFFIDGLHHAEQVYRDIINSLIFLNINGTIVVHDCNPLSYFTQMVPRPRRPKEWNGDVWKGWLKLRSEREDIEMFAIDSDYGCGIIRKGKQNLISKWNITYKEFEKDKKNLLNLISVEEFKNKFFNYSHGKA
jgi:hypothetical protein